MTRSNFDITDASDCQLPGEYGGEIELDDLKPSSNRVWDVGPPDPRDPLQPVDGGTVEFAQEQSQHADESPAKRVVSSRRIRWEIWNVLAQLIPTAVLVVICFLGFGFVEVVNHDIEQGKLDLQTYVRVIGWFVGGLLSLVGGGMALKNLRPDKSKQGDGSG